MRSILCALLLAIASGSAHADCPAVVTNAVKQAVPDATITMCKAETEDGRDQFEVKLTRKDGSKVDVDVSVDGKILQIEEAIALDKVPAAVTKAFVAKYPKFHPNRAEKQTHTGDKVTYFELAFQTDKGRKEATFAEDGRFVAEE